MAYKGKGRYVCTRCAYAVQYRYSWWRRLKFWWLFLRD
jgi:hypothetical protein